MRPLRLLTVIALLAGCSAAQKPTSNTAASPPASVGTSVSTSASTSTSPPVWIVTSHAVDLLRGGLTDQQLAQLFDNRDTYLVGPAIPGFTSAHRTASTPTLTNSVPPGADTLLYDDEAWPLTPHEQQLDPAKYEAVNHAFAQAHHLTYIATPATDLVTVLDPNGTGTVQDRFLRLGIIGDAARNADIVDIQAQGLEGSPRFADFVTRAAAQARAANPKVIVLAGVSTNPSGHAVAAQTLAADANAVRGAVDGYWLNVPSAGESCPRCGTPQPQVAYPWLKSLIGR
jgi:hypothetical protein